MYQKGIVVNVRYKSEYQALQNAKRRCFDPNHPQYRWYGARGITVFSGWLKNFMAFLKEVGEKSAPELTLDRIDNNKGYEPGNCRWVDRKTQCINRRKKNPRRIMGKTLSEWSKTFGYKNNGLYCYKRYHGLNYEEAINRLLIKKRIN